ncbi:MAG: hypothetical protein LIO49_08970 [Ruminococcus sp.]|nr:hypothetical protein [Ruminococcus sp.]
MPSTYAHYVLGRDLLRRYSTEVKNVLRNNLKIYQIGLHGSITSLLRRTR